jgi:hypothetical protein
MATPQVSVNFLNKTAPFTYAPGENIDLEVLHTDTDRASMTVNVSVTDSTGATGVATASLLIDQGTVQVVSSPARTWTLQSGSTAGRSVFRAVA